MCVASGSLEFSTCNRVGRYILTVLSGRTQEKSSTIVLPAGHGLREIHWCWLVTISQVSYLCALSIHIEYFLCHTICTQTKGFLSLILGISGTRRQQFLDSTLPQVLQRLLYSYYFVLHNNNFRHLPSNVIAISIYTATAFVSGFCWVLNS